MASIPNVPFIELNLVPAEECTKFVLEIPRAVMLPFRATENYFVTGSQGGALGCIISPLRGTPVLRAPSIRGANA